MVDKVIENNKVTIIGEVVSEFKFSHEVYGEGFYTVDISVNRLSNSVDGPGTVPFLQQTRRDQEQARAVYFCQGASVY